MNHSESGEEAFLRVLDDAFRAEEAGNLEEAAELYEQAEHLQRETYLEAIEDIGEDEEEFEDE